MDQRQYVYDYRTRKARLFLQNGALFDIESGSKLFTVEDDWAYGAKTNKPTFWIEGKNLYLYNGGSDLARHPTLYVEQVTTALLPRATTTEIAPTISPVGSRMAIGKVAGHSSSYLETIVRAFREAKAWMGKSIAEVRNVARGFVHDIASRRRQRSVFKEFPRKIMWDELDARDLPGRNIKSR